MKDMNADGQLHLVQVTPPAPWVASWPLVDLAACPEGNGFYALEAGGRVLHFGLYGDGRPREVAPPLPWRRPQPLLDQLPHTHQGDSRIIALPGRRVARFVSTEVRHIKNLAESLVEVWRHDGTCARRLRVRGVMPVLLGLRGHGAEAHLGWPGRYAADPWPSMWVALPEIADSDAVFDLSAAWSANLDAGDARRLRESERQTAPPQPPLPPDIVASLPAPLRAWAISPDATQVAVAAESVVAARCGLTAPWTCGQPPKRVADAFPRFEYEALREHLPQDVETQDLRFTLQVTRAFEMADTYSSVDFWCVVITERHSDAPPRVARLPEQPVAWAGELHPRRLLLRGQRGAWMCVDAEQGDVFALGGQCAPDRVAFALGRSGEAGHPPAGGGNSGAVVARLGEMRWHARTTPTVETLDLSRRRLLQMRPCGSAELPLALSEGGDLVLLQDGSLLRVICMSSGAARGPVTLEGDEADSAEWREIGFVVTSRRGAVYAIR